MAEQGEVKLNLQYRNTANSRQEGGKILLTGPPGVGKTRLAAELALALCGPAKSFLMDWPEEGGEGTLSDLDIPFYTFTKQEELEKFYQDAVKSLKPEALIVDSLPSMYETMMRMRAPSGIPPEDHGKTWRAVEVDLKREITRFKLMPSVKWFFMTSLVWPDKDEVTGQEGRNLIVIPGKLKANAYGLFDMVANIQLMEQGQQVVRILELASTTRTVAKMRVPPTVKIKPRVQYDLLTTGVKPILEALGLTGATNVG